MIEPMGSDLPWMIDATNTTIGDLTVNYAGEFRLRLFQHVRSILQSRLRSGSLRQSAFLWPVIERHLVPLVDLGWTGRAVQSKG